MSSFEATEAGRKTEIVGLVVALGDNFFFMRRNRRHGGLVKPTVAQGVRFLMRRVCEEAGRKHAGLAEPAVARGVLC